MNYSYKIIFSALIISCSLDAAPCRAVSHKAKKDLIVPPKRKKAIHSPLKTVHTALDNLGKERAQDEEFSVYERLGQEKSPANLSLGNYGKYSFGLGKEGPTCPKCTLSPVQTTSPSLSVPVLFIRGQNDPSSSIIPLYEVKTLSLHS